MNTAKSRHSFQVRGRIVSPPALDGEIARLEVEEQRGRGVQRPEQAGLADAGLAEDAALDAARLGQPLVGGDDGSHEGDLVDQEPGMLGKCEHAVAPGSRFGKDAEPALPRYAQLRVSTQKQYLVDVAGSDLLGVERGCAHDWLPVAPGTVPTNSAMVAQLSRASSARSSASTSASR
jgi:hypothetical protein